MPITAYPLTCPALFPRTPERDRKAANFGKKNRDSYGIKRLSVPAGPDHVIARSWRDVLGYYGNSLSSAYLRSC